MKKVRDSFEVDEKCLRLDWDLKAGKKFTTI